MAAPKGNKYALGLTTSGQPPFFESPEAMQAKIMDYFTLCEQTKENIKITGLCLYLGFESRQSFYDYEEREEFSYTVKRARMVVECHYEEGLNTFKYGGAVFGLKNMGWKDKTETDITTGGRMLGKQVDLTDLTDEELAVLERLKSR
jgi:hypothetical protein